MRSGKLHRGRRPGDKERDVKDFRLGHLAGLAIFLFVENLLVFTLQAFIPLGFNDGSTLWHWLRRR